MKTRWNAARRTAWLVALLVISVIAPSGRLALAASPVDPLYVTSDCGNSTSRVLLTYDDWPYDSGPTRLLRQARQLSDHGVGALYFPIGQPAHRYFQATGISVPARLRALGQMVGNHSLTHPHFNQLTRAQIRRQVEFGVHSTQFRFPYGERNTTALNIVQGLGYHECRWDADTSDYTGKTAPQVCSSVLAITHPGYTVIMHMREATFKATICIVRGLRQRGLQLCRPWRNSSGQVSTSPVLLPYRLPC